MRKVYLIRVQESEKEIIGVILFVDDNATWHTLHTLELPYKNNDSNISSIPEGTYTCIYTLSAAFKKYTYEVLDVPHKKGIRIHSANYFTQLRGCIALGTKISDVNKDGEIDVIFSKLAVQKFEDTMKQQPFTLTIL